MTWKNRHVFHPCLRLTYSRTAPKFIHSQVNGEHKRRVPLTSPQTFEVMQGMAEDRTWRMPAEEGQKTRSQTGFRYCSDFLVCDCIHSTPVSNKARLTLSLHSLCLQLRDIAGDDFVCRAPGYTVFRFPAGEGAPRLCLCGKHKRKLTFTPWKGTEDDTGKLVRAAERELKEAEEESEDSSGSDSSQSSFSSSDDDDKTELCPICEKECGRAGMAAHLDAAHRPAIRCVCKTTCPLCDTRIAANGLSQHIFHKHRSFYDEPRRCRICFTRCRTSSELADHMKTHA